MKRRTKIVWGAILGAIAVAVAIFWQKSDLVRQSDADLESMLAEAERNPNPDPNAPAAPSAERDWLVNAVRDSTGRTLEIEGAFDAYLLPLPGLLMGKASLSNFDGFGDLPFAVIDGMEVRVGSMSPFEKRVVIERAALAGLKLRLQRNAAGDVNWVDASTPQQPTSPAAVDPAAPSVPADPAAPAAPAAPAEEGDGWTTSVEAIEITDAEITWQDQVTGGNWKLSAFDLRASEIQPEADFPLTVSFAFEREAVAVAIESAMRASATGSPLQIGDLEFALRQIDPGDLRSLFSSAVVSGDPDLLARANSSASLVFKGAGTFDDVTRVLSFSGDVQLADGAVVPVTIGGTIDVPSVALGP